MLGRPETNAVIQTRSAVDPAVALPRLESGDHLSLAEFERRYDAMPGLKKAELIEGVVYMPSPVRWEEHARPHALVLLWIGTYSVKTPSTQVGDNGSVRLDGENMPQPDVALIIDPARGGQATLSDDGYVEGAPELIIEVSASTASIDLNTKLRVYQRNKVREYVVWRVLDRAVDWFRLERGAYQRVVADTGGVIRSASFPGLWLDVAALIELDPARVLDTLARGLADPTHAAFVARLQA